MQSSTLEPTTLPASSEAVNTPAEDAIKRSAKPFAKFNRAQYRRRQGGFTLVEILVVTGALVGLAAIAVAGFTLFQKKKNARTAVIMMRQLDSEAKQGLRDNFMNGVGFPTGYTIDTIGTYSPTLTELAPFLKLPGHTEGDTNITDTDLLGPGRTLVIGTLDEATTCTPPIDTTLVGNGTTTTSGGTTGN